MAPFKLLGPYSEKKGWDLKLPLGAPNRMELKVQAGVRSGRPRRLEARCPGLIASRSACVVVSDGSSNP